jgi:hypothetical protein
VKILAGLLCFLTITPAYADDAFNVLKNFGLIGTWDSDCTQPMVQSMMLYRFTETSLGLPRLLIGQPDDILSETTIFSATRINTDTLMLTTQAQPITVTLSGGILHMSGVATPLRLCISE